MKKVVLILATIGFAFNGIAQDKYVVSALTAINGNSYDEAKDNIDKAMASPETKEKPKALFAKAQIYLTLQTVDKYKASNPYREASQALIKLVEVKPDYEKANVDQMLVGAAFMYYNEGVKVYNDRNFVESAEIMKNVVRIHDLGGGKRFDGSPYKKSFDTVSADATLTIANCAYYSNKLDEAIPLLLKVKKEGIRESASVYQTLIDAYMRRKGANDLTDVTPIIAEARKKYPTDANIRNYELNYYILTGKQDELVKKLEDAVVSEPSNADLQFDLATTYLGMANPKDGKKPANTAELVTKSEAAFQSAIKLAPENAIYNYNFGALYFNQATDINDQMNAITGVSAADQKKYDDLKAKRDAMFGKSMPYFEKAHSIYAAQSNLKGEDLSTYKSTIIALKEVYARQNKLDKSKEMKAQLEKL
jgi:Tfp pilus assembly protein PilF